MPRTLHAELAQLAERRGVSLNQLIVGLLAGSVSNGDGAPPATASTDARVQKRLSIALTVNLVVLVLVGAVAIALLVVALSGGF